MRAVHALRLLLTFLLDVVLSGLSTAWLIVRPGPRPEPGLMRLPFRDLDPRGAAVLGGLITLTPGTTTLDIELDAEGGRGELLLHLLDGRDLAGTARSIRRRFEVPLRALFPGEGGDA